MITYKGITFRDYESFYNYQSFLGRLNVAQTANAQLANLANNIPLGPLDRPTCAYLEALYIKELNGN